MPTRDENNSGSKKVAQKSTPTTKKEISVEEGKASVNYTISITKNLGDYESLKIQAGITIPYGATDEMLKNLDDLMVTAREKVTSRLQADIEGITDSLNN